MHFIFAINSWQLMANGKQHGHTAGQWPLPQSHAVLLPTNTCSYGYCIIYHNYSNISWLYGVPTQVCAKSHISLLYSSLIISFHGNEMQPCSIRSQHPCQSNLTNFKGGLQRVVVLHMVGQFSRWHSNFPSSLLSTSAPCINCRCPTLKTNLQHRPYTANNHILVNIQTKFECNSPNKSVQVGVQHIKPFHHVV